jgi:hypothetical protein
MKVFALIQNRHSVYNCLGLFDGFIYEKISGYSIKTGEVKFFSNKHEALTKMSSLNEIEFKLAKTTRISQVVIVLEVNENYTILHLKKSIELSEYNEKRGAYEFKETNIGNTNFSRGAIAALQQEYNCNNKPEIEFNLTY